MTQPDQNFSVLSAADRRLIEDEHARLEHFLDDLRDTCHEFVTNQTCQFCDRARMACCKGRLNSFFHDFQDLVAQHFDNEETILRHLVPTLQEEEYFIRHQQAHERLMVEVREALRQSLALNGQGETAEAIRLLYRRIAAMFGEHARNFDDTFLYPT